MGLAEQHYKILTRYLGQGRKPTKREYERSKQHTIPTEWNAGQSQNWWVLAVGVRFAYGDFNELGQATHRLNQEQQVIGTWGSEQHSPIYWAFHVVGRLSCLKAYDGITTFDALAQNQLRDLFKYCELAMAPNGKEILWAGMRGTGHAEFASYELWWLYQTYILGKKVPKKKYWNQNPEDYAWLTNAWVKYYLTACQPENDVAGIRSPTHFINFGENNKIVYTEDDQHSSTVFKGASGYLNGQQINAPYNFYVRNRGEGASSTVRLWKGVTGWVLQYDGPYNKFRDARPIVFAGALPPMTSHIVWDKDGLHDELASPKAPEPVGGVVTTGSGDSFWKRVKDALRNYFSLQS